LRRAIDAMFFGLRRGMADAGAAMVVLAIGSMPLGSGLAVRERDRAALSTASNAVERGVFSLGTESSPGKLAAEAATGFKNTSG